VNSSVKSVQLEACYLGPTRLLGIYGVLFRQSGPPFVALGIIDRRSVAGLRLRPYSGQTLTRSKVSCSDIHACSPEPGARYRHYAGLSVISNPQINVPVTIEGQDTPVDGTWISCWIFPAGVNDSKKILTQSKRCGGDMGATGIHATALVNTRVFTQSRGRLSKAAPLKHAMPCAKKRLGCTTVTNPWPSTLAWLK
jgi:hypothetical protein